MSDEGALRVAVIGYGLAGRVFHAPLIQVTPGMTMSAIVTGDPGRWAAAKESYPDAALLASADEIWSAPDRYDLVVVATPNRFHAALALASISAGLPVVVDKPFARSAREAEEIVTAAETAGVPLTVFQNRRWDGDFLTIHALIEADTLGPIVRLESRFDRYRPRPRPGAWRESPDAADAGGLLFDLGSHLIDQAMVLFGHPRKVYAELRTRRPEAQVDDDTFVALTFDSGVDVHLGMSVVTRIVGPRFSLNGLRGSYVKRGLDPQEEALKDGLRPGHPSWGKEDPADWGRLSTEFDGLNVEGTVETLPGRYEEFYRRLALSLRGRGPIPVDPWDAVRSLTVIEAAARSSRVRRTVTLDQ